MRRKAVSGLMLVLLFVGLLPFVFNVRPVKASGTIYIKADGSIDPPTANITTLYNITYTFADNNYDEIVVQRDNIVVDGAGYVLQGPGDGYGMDLRGRSNVTIKNVTIKEFTTGIKMGNSMNNTIENNNIVDNLNGISGELWSDTTITNNVLTDNLLGIFCGYHCDRNTIAFNSITNHWSEGIMIQESSYNTIVGNNITDNNLGHFGDCGGIWVRALSSYNRFFHNNIIANRVNQVAMYWVGAGNTWDDSYPSGGNYWGDYAGVDVKSGPYQNETGNDGLGDTPYVIDVDNQDRYPLMIPFVLRGQHDIGIASTNPSETVVGEGYNAQIDVIVLNYGNNTETFNVTAYNQTSTIGTATNITLTSRCSTTITFTCNTSDFAKGFYFISFNVTPVPNETYTEDNTYTHLIFVTIVGDVDGDRDVDVGDQRKVALLMFKNHGDPYWNPNMDIDCDGDVDVGDQRKQQIHMFEGW